ncbi:hypothetical protein [Rhodococcus sp. NPDC056516]|uniref:hypothetical protein n=1 Tax=Rhodococcus sp. NPDC056516 TaxID=3345847 RepID=UPI00366FDACB
MRKVCAVAGFTALLVAAGTGAAAADPFLTGPESDIYTITTTETAATITLTAPSYQVCNAGLIVPGSPSDLNAQAEGNLPVNPPSGPGWTGGYEFLAHDPALFETPRFAGVRDLGYTSPRVNTIPLSTGTYTIIGKCTPYDENGNYAGDDVTHFASFTVGGTEEPGGPTDPGNPPTGGGSSGSLGSLFGS